MFPFRANHVDRVIFRVGVLIISWTETLLLDFGVCGIYYSDYSSINPRLIRQTILSTILL